MYTLVLHVHMHLSGSASAAVERLFCNAQVSNLCLCSARKVIGVKGVVCLAKCLKGMKDSRISNDTPNFI